MFIVWKQFLIKILPGWPLSFSLSSHQLESEYKENILKKTLLGASSNM